MSLWNEADFITLADLITVDAEVGQVAQAEGIVTDDPQSVMHRYIEDSGDGIMALMQQFGGYLSTQSVSANHWAAVMNVGLPAVNRSKILLSQVVVTTQIAGEWSALKRWVAYKCLEGFFLDASRRATSDRYQAKALEYRKDAHQKHWERLEARGLPIVRTPILCPGAAYEPGAGVWSASNVTAATQAGPAGGAWDVVITWVAAGVSGWISPAKKQNSESAASSRITKTTTAGQALAVSIAGLTAPNGAQPESTVSTALVAYGVATGWMIYAGPQGGPLYLQTPAPLPLTQSSYTFPSDPIQSSYLVGTGQYPDIFYSFSRNLQRG